MSYIYLEPTAIILQILQTRPNSRERQKGIESVSIRDLCNKLLYQKTVNSKHYIISYTLHASDVLLINTVELWYAINPIMIESIKNRNNEDSYLIISMNIINEMLS